MTDLIADKNSTFFDDLPYTSRVHDYCAPENLYTIAKIFKIGSVNVEKARVLDLGCGLGGNAISFASKYKDAEIVGVDSSKLHVDSAKKVIKELGLTNIEIKNISILDIDDNFGKFDYIICHGVFSWVSTEIQDKIFTVIKKHLAPNGLAYIGYNTLPGWNIVSGYREMLQFHAKRFLTKDSKLSQARAFLQFIKKGLEQTNSAYYQLLKAEADYIEKIDDSLLAHEYLSHSNSNMYFYEFMNEANKHELIYLADAQLPSMYINNLPLKAMEKLSTIPDIVRTEQYMDFITNRRSRSTILIHPNTPFSRNVDHDAMDDMWISMQANPSVSLDEADFSKPSLMVEFRSPKGVVTITGAPLCAAIYAICNKNGAYISINDIEKFIQSKCPNFSVKTQMPIVKSELVSLLFKGILSVRAVKPITAKVISEHPQISEFAQYQINHGAPVVFDQLNNSVEILPLQRIIMKQLNGKTSIDQIISNVEQSVKNNELTLNIDEKPVTDLKLIEKAVRNLVAETLTVCLAHNFLVK